MQRTRQISGVILTSGLLLGMSLGQTVTPQAIVSSPPSASAPNEAADLAPGTVETALDPASLLPDLPRLPNAKATLVGGTIEKLDRIRDEITVQVFGGGRMKIFFDPRTRISHDGADGSTSDLKQGDRVYVDTILDGSLVFARNIRLRSALPAGGGQGVVTRYRSDKGELEIRDAISPRPLKVRVTGQTRIINAGQANAGQAASASEFEPGTLVAVKFGSQNGSDIAQEISVLALPGASFTFAGRVTALDLRLGIIVITTSADHKTFDLYLDPSTAVDSNLRSGSSVTVEAKYDGSRYAVRNLTINAQ